MSETVGSAIVGEAVSRVISGMISKYVDGPDERDSLERLEMAHIKMEAAIEISSKWQITDVSLLRWRRKLKRAYEECDHTMRESKRRSQEDRTFQDQIKQSSFPRRVAHATKSFVSSVIVGQKNDECPSKATVRRFERLADGANDFLRYIQIGGPPRQYMFFDPLIKHLFAGKFLEYEEWRRSQYYYFGILPVISEGRGLEAHLGSICVDRELPDSSFHLGCILRLSESTDVIGIMIKCLQLATPHFKSTAKFVMQKLIELPTQDFCWLPCNAYGNMEHWNNIHNTLTRRLRPNALCCQGYNDLTNMPPVCTSRSATAARLSGLIPEPICHVFLQRYIPDYNSIQGPVAMPALRLGFLFAPHDDFKSAIGVECSATETVDGEKRQCAHFDAHPDQLDEKLLPKAIDYLSRNDRAATYQISWKSTHGSAHLSVDKINMQTIIAECGTKPQGHKKSKFHKLQDRLINKGQWKQVVRGYLNLWGLCSRSLGC